MKKKLVLVLLNVILAYSPYLVAMGKIPSKDREALRRISAEVLRRSNEGLSKSTETQPLKSSSEIMRPVTVQNYAGFPHSGMITEELYKSLASSASKSFTEYFYDFP